MSSSATARSLPTLSLRNTRQSGVLQRRKDQPREQVAAVCYRIHNDRLEILLVRTRRGERWIFPKGGVEPGLTRSQSAALEALEEAGVHGSIEEAPFANYAIPQSRSEAGLHNESTIAVYLCAVTWLTSPHEANRNPTWFSPEKAKKQLARSRERYFARELCRVVDRAVMRVERLQSYDFKVNDPLRRTDFESPAAQAVYSGWHAEKKLPTLPSLVRMAGPSTAVDVRRLAVRRVLQLGPAPGPPHGIQFVSRPDGLSREAGQRKRSRVARNFSS